MSRLNLYLILAIVGFIAPNILVFQESIETGNILLYLHPMETMKGMFANRIASIFMIDLLLVVMMFFIWSYQRGKSLGKKVYLIWVLTMLFGIAFGFPLFLYLRERQRVKGSEPQ